MEVQGWERGSTCLLIHIDFLQALVELSIKACLTEVVDGVLGEALLVELSLKILEREGVVEDVNVSLRGGIVVGPLQQSRER